MLMTFDAIIARDKQLSSIVWQDDVIWSHTTVPVTFRLPIPVHFYGLGGAGTPFTCVPMHFNHWMTETGRQMRGWIATLRLPMVTFPATERRRSLTVSKSYSLANGAEGHEHWTICPGLVAWHWPRPFQGWFFIRKVGLGMVSQCTKFEVSRFTRYEAVNGGAKCRKRFFGAVMGHSRSSAMLPFDRAHTTSYSTLIETMHLSCTVFQI